MGQDVLYQRLEDLHLKTGKTLLLCSRLMATVVTLGSVFCLMMIATFYLVYQPAHLLRLRAFAFNYIEMAQAQDARTAPASPASGRLSMQDPRWDGMMAGVGLGYTLGRNVPLIGGVVGPLVGAVVGYQADDQI